MDCRKARRKRIVNRVTIQPVGGSRHDYDTGWDVLGQATQPLHNSHLKEKKSDGTRRSGVRYYWVILDMER